MNLLQQWESLLQAGREGWSPMLHTLTQKHNNILLVVSGLDLSLPLGLSF